MKKLSQAIIKAILSGSISSELKSRLETPTSIIQEEVDFSNPITLLPEVPCPIDPSDLTYDQPHGYMWSDGVMTETEDRASRVVKKHTPFDEWIPTDTPSHFNKLLEDKQIPEKLPTSDTYIL